MLDLDVLLAPALGPAFYIGHYSDTSGERALGAGGVAETGSPGLPSPATASAALTFVSNHF